VNTLIPLLPIGLIGIIAIYGFTMRMPSQERDWLRNVLLCALAARLLAASLFAVIPETRVFHEDAAGYERIGMRIANGWLGQGPSVHVLDGHEQNFGFQLVCASIYYIFGTFPAAVSFFNAVLGTMTVLLVYNLARLFFHQLVAKRAALLVAFFPSMVLWSSIALKDPLMTFLIVLALSSCISLKRRFTAPALVGTVLSIAATLPIRFYMLYFLGFAVLSSIVIERGARSVAGIYKLTALAGLLIVLIAISGVGARAQEGVEYLSLERVSTFRKGMADTAHSGFANDVDISTARGVIAFLPIGVANLLLSPFPWQFTSARALLAAPETILWWLLIPSLWRGLRFAVRHRFAETSPILVFSLVLTLGYSLMQGNVGAAFRQRAQIFVFLFIFAALGLYEQRCKKHGIDSTLLLADADRSQSSAA
jgi:4-amino-4-deoxy-L-arabinose transferase-like glycosyltransferase